MYLDYGLNSYHSVSSVDSVLISNNLFGDSRDFFKVSTSQGSLNVKRQVPEFRTLFKNSNLFNPSAHRIYFFQIPPLKSGASFWDYSYYYRTLEKFNSKKLELETVVKDDKLLLTFSDDFVAYLKSNDMKFVQSVGLLNYYIDFSQKQIPRYQLILDRHWSKEQHLWDSYKGIVADYKRAIKDMKLKRDNTNKEFKTFISDLSNSAMNLNKPFILDTTDPNYGFGTVTSIGNFSSHELDSALNSIFGDITNDGFYPVGSVGKSKTYGEGLVSQNDIGFVPSANEINYNSKVPTSCCILLEISPLEFRDRDVEYIDSPDFIEDSKKFEEYKKTDNYLSQPKRDDSKGYTTVSSYDMFLKEFLGDVNNVKSPLTYLNSKIMPYLASSLIKYLEDNGTPHQLPKEGGVIINFDNFDLEINVPQKSFMQQHFETHNIRSFY